MEMKIGVIKGDGIGPEITGEAVKVLDKVAEVYGHTCHYTQLLMGGASIDVHGMPLTEETVQKARECDAVLMGPSEETRKCRPGISWNRTEDRRPDF